jgi:hypothetical protein
MRKFVPRSDARAGMCKTVLTGKRISVQAPLATDNSLPSRKNAMYWQPTITDVEALKKLEAIPRPEGDNEGDPINSPGVYESLTQPQQQLVDTALETAHQYVRKSSDFGDEPNARSITELNKRGYHTFLQPDQYDPTSLTAGISIGPWELDLSDEPAKDGE